jgi:hypothetical protein
MPTVFQPYFLHQLIRCIKSREESESGHVQVFLTHYL